jgi:type IV pilus assembly protein PilA
MGPMWSDALRRAADALARRRNVVEGEEGGAADAGFTLIELMLVLLIMGILMAIAIPTFLGVTSVANDRSTQSNLTNVLTSGKALYASADGFNATTTVAKTLKKQDNSFNYVTGASSKQGTVSVYTNGKAGGATGTTLAIAAFMTKTKVCWFITDVESGTKAGVVYGYDAALTATTCKATTFKTVTETTIKATPPSTKPSKTGNVFGKKWPTAPTGQ